MHKSIKGVGVRDELRGERQLRILRELRSRGQVNGSRLAVDLGVSLATVRRDLEQLEAQGLLMRVHGGAVLPRGAATAVLAPDAAPGRQAVTIGMVVPTVRYYFGPIIRGAEQAARAAGVRLLVVVSDYSVSAEISLLRRLVGNGVDGILLSTALPAYAPDSDLVTTLGALPRPVVLVERDPDEVIGNDVPLECVRTDHVQGARNAVLHLRASGHERIALLSPGQFATRQLRKGYTATLEALGLEPMPFFADDNWMDGGRAALSPRILDSLLEKGITAVIVHPEQDAVDIAQAALTKGLSIPNDLAIVAYDDEIASLFEIPLTSVAPPKHQVGFQAMRRCLDLVTDPVHVGAVQHTAIQPTLRRRRSTIS